MISEYAKRRVPLGMLAQRAPRLSESAGRLRIRRSAAFYSGASSRLASVPESLAEYRQDALTVAGASKFGDVAPGYYQRRTQLIVGTLKLGSHARIVLAGALNSHAVSLPCLPFAVRDYSPAVSRLPPEGSGGLLDRIGHRRSARMARLAFRSGS
ncbi:MAG TPA: hypothetical protein VIX91_15810 [Candidatus Acidoferrum sp.]